MYSLIMKTKINKIVFSCNRIELFRYVCNPLAIDAKIVRPKPKKHFFNVMASFRRILRYAKGKVY